MLKRVYLNKNWLFQKDNNSHSERVELPHSNNISDFNYVNKEDYETQSIYKLNLNSEIWKLNNFSTPQKYILTFEGAAHFAEVFINDELIGNHSGGYTAFSFDITKNISDKNEVEILVKLDSRESLNIPPFGNVIDYLTYGGLYRGVYLDICSDSNINDITIKTINKRIDISYDILSDNYSDLIVKGNIINSKTNMSVYQFKESNLHSNNKLSTVLNNCELWSLDSPNLYKIELSLYKNEELFDIQKVEFGIRDIEFKEDGFYLNGNKIDIIGLNRHQSFPYIGYALPKRAQEIDALILKNELGLNAVRTSHYPQSQDFLNMCDKLGLLVFTEIPGWQHIGNKEWQNIAKIHVKEMISQYKNHPSIIIWGVRINESQDNDEFYLETNRIAKELDDSRATGGVRYIKKSNLLEDVYTYNDFIHTGNNQGISPKKDVTPNTKKPYLISEFNGHMFPTKSFDSESHRLEHALRHCRVLSDIYKAKGIAGGFGWCMFDYNTHEDFGSGDGICYHGVLDMFRNPKLASSVYSSQKSISESYSAVLEISSTMSIGDHPGGYIGDIVAFTNADSIKVYKNDLYVGEFLPDNTKYSGLPHPPVIINDLIGDLLVTGEGYHTSTANRIKKLLRAIAKYGANSIPLKYKLSMLKLMIFNGITIKKVTDLFYKYIGNWGDAVITYRFDAIHNEEIVKTVYKKPAKKIDLSIKNETEILEHGITYDTDLIRIKGVNENSEVLPYLQEPVKLKVSGPIKIIGPDIISLKGGMGGTYIRTTEINNKESVAKLTITMGNIKKEITWRVL